MANTSKKDITRITTLKLNLAYAILFILFIIANLAANFDFSRWGGLFTELNKIPWKSLADAFLTTLLVACVYEGWIRRENSRELHESLFSKDIVRWTLSKDKVAELLDAGFQNLLDNNEFGSQMYSYFADSAFSAKQRRYDAHVTVLLLPLEDSQRNSYNEDQRVHFYNVRMIYSYKREITDDYMIFRCMSDLRSYQNSYRDSEVEFRWYVPPMRLFPAISQDFFTVTECSMDGVPQSIVDCFDDASGDIYYKVDTRLHKKSAKAAKVDYVIDVRVQRFSHCLYLSIREPTLRHKISFDFSAVDLSHVTAYPSYASPAAPQVRYLPNAERPTRVEVELDAWCIPDSATLFAWVMDHESNHNFRASLKLPS